MKVFRIIAMILCLSMLPAIFIEGTAAETTTLDTSDTIADAILGGTLQSNNFETVTMGTSPGAVVVQRDGVSCWLLDISQGNNKAYMNFIFDETFKSEENDGSEYLFEIEYFDAGKGYCRLFYDALDSDKKDGGTIYTNNTSQWKTAMFTVQDGNFKKGVDGQYDFQLSVKAKSERSSTSAASIAIRRVKVTKLPDKNPIYLTATNDEIGHTYRWYENSKIIHNKFENLSDQSITVDVNYKMISAEEIVPFEKSETLTFAPREVKEFDLDFGEVERCDIYRYEVTINSEDGRINSSFMPFEVTVIKTDPDGILNKDVMFAAHLERYPIERARDGVAMLKMSNSYGIRSDFGWGSMEKTIGVLDWTKHSMYNVVECLRENGLSYMPILDTACTLYGLAWNELPRTEEQLEAWSKFARYTAEILGDMVDCYEIWNEPNITSFNQLVGTPDGDGCVYAKMAIAAAKEIHEVDPTAKVGGPAITNVMNSPGMDYFSEAMEAGIYEYVDAVTLHPYAGTAPDVAGMDEAIQWYKDQYAAAGKPDPDIWNTEVGYTSATEGITEEVKGTWNIRSALLYKAKDLGEKNVFYNFEKKGTILTDREDQFGHVSGGYDECIRYGKYWVPTISYVMVTGHNYIMADSEADEIYDSADKNIRILKFKSNKFNTDIVTLYAVDGVETVTLKLGADKVTVYDAKGNPTEVTGKDGVFTFTADQIPKYILGDMQTVELLENTALVNFDTLSTVVAEDDTVSIGMTKIVDGDYTIDVSAPPSCAVLETVEEFDPVTGKGAVIVKNLAQTDVNYQVEVRTLNEDGSLMQTATVDITVGVAVAADMSVALASSDDASQWEATMTITNYSNSKALKGQIEFKSPSDFAAIGQVDLGAIPRGNTGQIKFMLPKLSRLGQYTVEYDIVTATGERFSFSSRIDFTVASYAYNKPVIDGVVDDGEWNFATAMYADQVDQIVALENDWVWEGVNDLSARSSIMWDEENMYLVAEVTDDIFCQPYPITGETWNGDNMQFGVFYGEQGFLAIGQASTTFNEINLALSPEGAGAYRTMSQDNFCSPGVCEDAEVAITRQGNKTTYELRMPWASLLRPGDQPKAGDLLGFSFLFNENDGNGRCGWIEYASGIGLNKDTTLFTYMKLIK